MMVKVKTIAEADLLAAVKTSLNISGEHFDETLKLIIDEVKGYMLSAGVKAEILDSTLAVG